MPSNVADLTPKTWEKVKQPPARSREWWYLQNSFQFAGFSKREYELFFMDGGEWVLRQALLSETLSHILVLLIIESVCGWDAIIAVFVWCRESRQKCCQRQHIEIRLNTGEALLLLLLVALVLENNVWFLGAYWLYLSNCQTPVISFWQPFDRS